MRCFISKSFFIDFVRECNRDLAEQLIAIDGKALRQRFEKQGRHIHLFSVYACEQGISLVQLEVDTKSNEIIAILEHLDLLDIEAQTISIDVMGSQKDLARNIHFAYANYILALKGNHPLALS